MLTHVRKSIEVSLGSTKDFISTFKSYGWYLDELVLTPVNQMNGADRLAACRDAELSLPMRLAEYRPLAIVSLLKIIHKNVDRLPAALKPLAKRWCLNDPILRKLLSVNLGIPSEPQGLYHHLMRV